MTKLTDEIIKKFQDKIFEWWEKNKRDLPWRKTTDPYYIMVSEVMLQQTQVSRVKEKYEAFIKKFPTKENLAEAETAEVLKIWSGLGYNKRALWLQQAATQLVEGEEFPKKPEELEKIKGIGKYTARAILIFAFNHDLPTVDTNIRRILISEGFATEEATEKELFKIAAEITPKGRARDWYNALMDYGSMELTARKTGIKPKTSQKKFNNSTRYQRGKIVKALIKKGALTKKEISEECEIDQKVLAEILTKLIVEGLVVKKRQYYQLK